MRVNFKESPLSKYLEKVEAVEITNDNGVSLEVVNWGARLVSCKIPATAKNMDEKIDIVVGYESFENYIKDVQYRGATVGRFANRIRDGVINVLGKTYQLSCNEGKNHLHGGNVGLNRCFWKVQTIASEKQAGVVFSYEGRDGEEGYPGNISCTVTYLLNNSNELIIQYQAHSDKDTVLNLTNHTYWNVTGRGQTEALTQELMIEANHIVETDAANLATGNLVAVDKTCYDFRSCRKIFHNKIDFYDNCYVLNKEGGEVLQAELRDSQSERGLQFFTTQPGLQLYTGAAGICVEAQYLPDAMRFPNFKSPVLRAGDTYFQTTKIKFLF